MSLKKAYEIIKKYEGHLGVSNFSLKSSRKISRLVYKTFPNIDKNPGPFSNFSISYSEKQKYILMTLLTEYCIFEFFCKENSISFYQHVRGQDHVHFDIETVPDFTEKEITSRIKRKQFPRQKRKKLTQDA